MRQKAEYRSTVPLRTIKTVYNVYFARISKKNSFMKRSEKHFPLFSFGLAAVLLCSTPLFAQDASKQAAQDSSSSSSKPNQRRLTSSSVREHTSSEIPRFWFGLTGSYVPFKLVQANTTTNATTGEIISSTAANGQAGGGAVVNMRVLGGWWVSIGSIYRFGGYDTTDQVNANTIYLERTRANYLDFPALVKYAGPHFRWSKYSFYEAGATVRYLYSYKLQQAANNGFDYYCCAPPSTTGIRKTTEGVVVGTGVTGRDDFGIVVSPEVRYTRWMSNTFTSPTIGTMRNQLEVTISFGF